MGGISSSPVEPTFEEFKSWNLSAAKDSKFFPTLP
jgi:hypothetical protein